MSLLSPDDVVFKERLKGMNKGGRDDLVKWWFDMAWNEGYDVADDYFAPVEAENKKLKAFLSDLLNGDVVFTGPSAERLRHQAADLLEPNEGEYRDTAQD